MIQEKRVAALPGFFMMFLLILVLLLSIAGSIYGATHGPSPLLIVSSTLSIVAASISFAGLTVVNPNESQVVQLFGTYIGTLKEQGFWWVNPFSSRRKVSLRIRNFESAKLKVNDTTAIRSRSARSWCGACVETAEAMFDVDNYENFVTVQTEAALRNLATLVRLRLARRWRPSLRSHIVEVADQLKVEVQERLTKAGVEVIEARISHLAYAPEIASAMLQRQQASAIIAARTKIVEGAVGMVEMALDELGKKNVVQLDEERKAAMVSNLLVVLCSNAHTQPVVNTGTLYH